MVSPTEQVRLLPWASPEGKPCYLVGGGTGYVSRLADDMEAAQLEISSDLIKQAHQFLAERAWTPGELHLLAVQLSETLANTHRIAVSRRARLPAPAYENLAALESQAAEENTTDPQEPDLHG